jgi:hypothetical protein
VAPTACPHKTELPQLFAKILFQQVPQSLSNAVNWIQSELLLSYMSFALTSQFFS